MNVRLSEHFNYKKLLKFTFPSIIMMIFTSIYVVIDGLFVSNFVGKVPFAAINLIMPLLMIFGAIGFMIGAGGSALVSKKLGEGNKQEANEIFSLLVYTTVVIGILVSIIGIILLRPISIILGAEGELLENCIDYGKIIIPALTALMLQSVFQSLLITAGKPNIGLVVTIIAGITNIILDALFIVVFKWGVSGAAAATAIAQCIGGIIPLIYFISKNTSELSIGRAKWNKEYLIKTFSNGASEFTTNISMSVVNICYNYKLMEIAGEDGIASYGVIMYVAYLFISLFLGYSIGSAPIIGYHYGSANYAEIKNLLKKSLVIICCFGISIVTLAQLMAVPLSGVFVGYDKNLLSMTVRGLRIYSLSFFISGINIFASSFFTALNNGKISATISFLRTLLFQISAVMILPIIFGLDGIWSSIIVAEILALIVSVFFLIKMKPVYKY